MLGIKTLEDLCEGAASVAAHAEASRDSWEEQTAIAIFRRQVITCLSLLRLIPSSKYYSAASGTLIWDLTSTAALTRTIIENYLLLHYVAVDDCSEEERECRKFLWQFHDASHRLKVMKLALPPSQHAEDPREHWNECFGQLEDCEYFQQLPKTVREKVFNGEEFKLLSNQEIARRAGISERYYSAAMKYCSCFSHTSPYSISQMDAYQSGTPEGDRMFKHLTYLTAGFMALALRDFLAIFPEQSRNLPKGAKHAVAFWETVLKWEKLPWFEDSPVLDEPVAIHSR